MKKTLYRLLSMLLVFIIIFSLTNTIFAHSGRTDSDGGHKDNKNKSGLGSYHYHCGGYPAHLHTYDYCPYRDVFPTKVIVKSEKSTLGVGESVALSATVRPANACDTDVQWESSNTEVVKIRNGMLVAVGPGTAVIKATSFNNKVGKIQITVEEKEVESIEILDEDMFIFINDTVSLSAVISPTDATYRSVFWESSDDSVLSIDNTGTVTALSCGTSIVSARSLNGLVDTIQIEVKEIVAEKIEITGNDSLKIGSASQLWVTYYPINTTFKDIRWESSDDNIITIDENGVIYANDIGVATITAIQKDTSAMLQIEVLPIKVEHVEIEAELPEKLISGNKYNFFAEVLPTDATYPEITWTSDNDRIANIDANGVLTTRFYGKATITASTQDGVFDTYEVVVHLPDSVIFLIIFCIIGILGLGVVIIVHYNKKKKK